MTPSPPSPSIVDPWAVYESELDHVLAWGRRLTEPLVIQHNRYAMNENLDPEERAIAQKYYARRENVRGFEGFILGRLHDHRATQRFLRQYIELHIRTVLEDGSFPAGIFTTKNQGRIVGKNRITPKTVSRDYEKLRPALAIDEKIGRERHVASLLRRETQPLSPTLEHEIEDMLDRMQNDHFEGVQDIQDLRLLEPSVARSLVTFRDLCVKVFDKIVGFPSPPTHKQRWLRLLLRSHTDFLVSLHATCTAAAGLHYVLGRKSTREDLLLQDVAWGLSRTDVEESVPQLATLWYEDAPFIPWLYEVGSVAFRHGELQAAMVVWNHIFWEGWEQYPHHAAYACRDMGMAMHGAWVSGGEPEWRKMADEWLSAAIMLFRNRDEGQMMLSAWCLRNINPARCLELVPDYATRMANLENPPNLLVALMERHTAE